MIEIAEVQLDWPGGNEELAETRLGGGLIWDERDTSSPTLVQSNWGPGSRTVTDGGVRTLKFFFEEEPVSSGYNLTVTFDNGCQVSAGN